MIHTVNDNIKTNSLEEYFEVVRDIEQDMSDMNSLIAAVSNDNIKCEITNIVCSYSESLKNTTIEINYKLTKEYNDKERTPNRTSQSYGLL